METYDEAREEVLLRCALLGLGGLLNSGSSTITPSHYINMQSVLDRYVTLSSNSVEEQTDPRPRSNTHTS